MREVCVGLVDITLLNKKREANVEETSHTTSSSLSCIEPEETYVEISHSEQVGVPQSCREIKIS